MLTFRFQNILDIGGPLNNFLERGHSFEPNYNIQFTCRNQNVSRNFPFPHSLYRMRFHQEALYYEVPYETTYFASMARSKHAGVSSTGREKIWANDFAT